MSEIFIDKFHKWYVGGEGEVMEKPLPETTNSIVGMSYDEVLKEYRDYVGDQSAELPEVILNQLEMSGKLPA